MSLYYFGGGRRARTVVYILYSSRAPAHFMVNDFEERKRRIQSNKISRISHLLPVWLLFYIAHVRTGAARGSTMNKQQQLLSTAHKHSDMLI